MTRRVVGNSCRWTRNIVGNWPEVQPESVVLGVKDDGRGRYMIDALRIFAGITKNLPAFRFVGYVLYPHSVTGSRNASCSR